MCQGKESKVRGAGCWVAGWMGFLWATALLWTAGQGAAQAWTVSEILAGVQMRYQEIRDLEADFLQEATLPMVSRVTEARGRLYLKIPGKMRWEYLEGQEKIVVINGHTMWFYEPREQQVTITDLNRVPNSQELLTFLTGMGDLRKEFIVDEGQTLVETREGYAMVKLLPRSRSSQWTSLRLLVDPRTFHVVQTAFEGVQGDRTVIQYHNIRTDVGLPEELFQFQIPEGAEVLHYPPEGTRP